MPEQVKTQVKIPPVVIELHWPTVACPQCAGEVETVSTKMYMCLSCRHVDSGKTQVLSGQVRLLA